MTKMCSISRGIYKNIDLSIIKRYQTSIKIDNNYTIYKNILMYLASSVGYIPIPRTVFFLNCL